MQPKSVSESIILLISKRQKYIYILDARNWVDNENGLLCLFQNVKNDCMKMGWFLYMASETSAVNKIYLMLLYSVTIIAYMHS